MRGWWRFALTALAAIASVASCRAAAPAQGAACERAASAHDVDSPGVCLTMFAITGDAAHAGRAALELTRRQGTHASIQKLARAIGDRLGGADAWNALGNEELEHGDQVAAIAAFNRAKDHRAPTDLLGRRRDARGLYRSYFENDEYGLAMHNAAVAYELSKQPGDPETRANILNGVATLLYDIGDLPTCEAVMAEADAVIGQQAPARGGFARLAGTFDASTRLWVSLRGLHGLVDEAHARYQLARTELSEAAEVARENRLTAIARYDALNLAFVELQGGDVDAASAALATAPPFTFEDAVARRPFAHAEALVALARGRNQEAIEITTHALAGLSALMARDLYALRGRALVRVHRAADAEATLLRSLEEKESEIADLDLDSLKGWLLDQRREPFEDLFALYVGESRIGDALDVAQRATARAFLDGLAVHGGTPSEPVSQAIERAGERVEGMRVLAHALRASPAAHPLAGKALRDRLGDRDVLTYFRTGDELWLIAVARGREPRAHRIGDVADVRRRAKAWLADPARLDLADDLGARLLPAELLPSRDRVLYVVVDDPIREVPFASLRLDGAYLVQRNPIAYVPSAAVLASLVDRPARNGPPVVVGDPGGDLPAARREADEVAALIGVDAAVGMDATRATVLSGNGAALLHVAGHTRRTPIGPALALADGVVNAGDVIERGVAAQVVVLTSCASADPSDPDQLGPLASAFLATGSGAVVASRWAVDDETALQFARYFYAAGGVDDPVLATAVAQRRLAADGADVFSWGTFVVLGGAASPVTAKENKR